MLNVCQVRNLAEKQHGEVNQGEGSGNICRRVSIEANTDEEAEDTTTCVFLWFERRGFIIGFKSMRDWISASKV